MLLKERAYLESLRKHNDEAFAMRRQALPAYLAAEGAALERGSAVP